MYKAPHYTNDLFTWCSDECMKAACVWNMDTMIMIIDGLWKMIFERYLSQKISCSLYQLERRYKCTSKNTNKLHYKRIRKTTVNMDNDIWHVSYYLYSHSVSFNIEYTVFAVVQRYLKETSLLKKLRIRYLDKCNLIRSLLYNWHGTPQQNTSRFSPSNKSNLL